ncbi:sulfotransferase [Nitzschia inconspicua]|uniref:Sulfotransferase n=1 Tax=Nitzschia inconspicua TaxID=303405 RepID=A0A9K3LJL4_9STRA|nr:sulfotransferase [Nitzschia inconspicua]KAG7362925.1 sulfotransferase [Nitzschia inconspicua]
MELPQPQQQHTRHRLQQQRIFPLFFLVLTVIGVGWRLTIVLDRNQAYVMKFSNATQSKSQSSFSKATVGIVVRSPQEFTLLDGTVVSVGMIGPKIVRAQRQRLVQRNTGYPWQQWDILESDDCRNGTKSSFGTLGSTTPSRLIRKHWLPHAILIGVQKGGTTALYQYMDQHPNIVKSQKELYFLDEVLDQYLLQQQEEEGDIAGGLPQTRLRQAYSAKMKQAVSSVTRNQGHNQQKDHHTNEMLVDWTPNYLFESDRLPARISCIVPWAKLMVLLRNPVDRARSQYDMKLRIQESVGGNTRQTGRSQHPGRNHHHIINNNKLQSTAPPISFKEYVHNDLGALQEAGVIQDWDTVNFDLFFYSPAMDEAWRTYMNNGLNAPIGMGLYAIQLKPFLKMENDFLAIQSEKLMQETDEIYGQVLDFLGLERISLEFYPKANHAAKKQMTAVDEETEKLLRHIFEPFNRKLGELLGKEWEHVWEE